MDSLPRDDESADDYRRRLSRERWRRRFIVTGVILLCITVLGIYAAMTVKPIAKIGETCGGTDKIECESGAWCWSDGSRCLKSCAPRIDDHCPAGTSCEMFEVIGEHGSWSGRAFACKPTR